MRRESVCLCSAENAFASVAVYFSFDLAVCHDPKFVGNIRKIIEPVLTEQQRFALLFQGKQNLF